MLTTAASRPPRHSRSLTAASASTALAPAAAATESTPLLEEGVPGTPGSTAAPGEGPSDGPGTGTGDGNGVDNDDNGSGRQRKRAEGSDGPAAVAPVEPMAELALEPPALSPPAPTADNVGNLAAAAGVVGAPEAAAAAAEVVAAVQMAENEGRGSGVLSSAGAALPAPTERAGAESVGGEREAGIDRHLDLVLEALVRIRGIVAPHSR